MKYERTAICEALILDNICISYINGNVSLLDVEAIESEIKMIYEPSNNEQNWKTVGIKAEYLVGNSEEPSYWTVHELYSKPIDLTDEDETQPVVELFILGSGNRAIKAQITIVVNSPPVCYGRIEGTHDGIIRFDRGGKYVGRGICLPNLAGNIHEVERVVRMTWRDIADVIESRVQIAYNEGAFAALKEHLEMMNRHGYHFDIDKIMKVG